MAAAPGPQSLKAPCPAAPPPAALSPRAAVPAPVPRAQRWVFSREQLHNTPSRRCGVEADRELSYRQQAANLIQDMGQRLNVSQLTINTAIVYMHRFYMHHSFTKFHRNTMSPTTLFLAAKVEEQPRKLEHVIKVAHACLNPTEPPLDTKSNAYLQQAQELHRPTVIACVCIHLACKWSNWEIPVSTDGKHWWEYVDPTVTIQLLDELTHEFLQILEKTPSRLKRIRNWRATQAAKKPRTDSFLPPDTSALPGPSLLQHQPLLHLDPPCSLPLPPLPPAPLPLPSTAPSTSAFPNASLRPEPGANTSAAPPQTHKLSLDRYREKHKVDVLAESGDTKGNKERRHHHGDRSERRPRASATSDDGRCSNHRGAPTSPPWGGKGAEDRDGAAKKRSHPGATQTAALNHQRHHSGKVCKSPAGLRPHLFSSDSPRDVGEHRH